MACTAQRKSVSLPSGTSSHQHPITRVVSTLMVASKVSVKSGPAHSDRFFDLRSVFGARFLMRHDLVQNASQGLDVRG